MMLEAAGHHLGGDIFRGSLLTFIARVEATLILYFAGAKTNDVQIEYRTMRGSFLKLNHMGVAQN